MEMDKNIPPVFQKGLPWNSSKESIWLATLMSIHRNLSPFSFPPKMGEIERLQTLGLLQEQLCPLLKTPTILTAGSLSPHQKEFIFEHFNIQDTFEKFDPGHAIILDESIEFLALVNVADHLQLYLQSSEIPLQDLYGSLAKYERALSKRLPFAFSSRFGYLTADPAMCGTGLIVQAFLHMPAALQLDTFADWVQPFGEEIYFYGLGKERDYIGDVVVVENRYKLGTTEEDIVKTVERAAQTLVEKERQLRLSLPKEKELLLKDKVCRAFGLLSHSYQLQLQETLSAMSLIHLAKELNWVANASQFSFTDLFFQIKRAHLLETLQVSELSKEEIQHKRAESLHQKLKNALLTIS